MPSSPNAGKNKQANDQHIRWTINAGSPSRKAGLPVVIKFMDMTDNIIESHPLRPFLPHDARLLMLGSFPPPRQRWCMDFFYPNWNNDMWRIWGIIASCDKDHFVVPGEKRFDRARIEDFCRGSGIALYDTAEQVIRLRGNASDNFLQVVQPADIAALLERLPACRAIAATGQKSAEVLQSLTACAPLQVGGCVEAVFARRRLALWRMPSSSRAYPMKVERKAEVYARMWDEVSRQDAGE